MTASWKVRAWYAADALVRQVRPARLRAGVRSIHAGVCLGLASDELLVAVDEEAYARRRYAYHDTDAHNLRGLFDWEERALASSFPAQGRVLVTSAGGGREVVALWRRGYEVVACECNERLRARANALLRRLGADIEVLPAPRDHCLVRPEAFDAAVVGWGSYTFIRGTARRRAFLAELAQSLRPGAPALLSFFARRGDALRFQLIRTVGNAVARVGGGERVEIGDVIDPTWQHYVARHELAQELASAGLHLERWSQDGYAHAIARRIDGG
jgi:SAM-dependent methyltransferase